MCFSATASFTLAAALVPAGLLCLKYARSLGIRWIGLAVYPLAFSLQQALEGLVWVGLDRDAPGLVNAGAHGYLFFSHLFWLMWVPFSVLLLQFGREASNRAPLTMLLIAGSLLGLVLYSPILAMTDPVPIAVQSGSLAYDIPLLFGGEPVRFGLKLAYFAIMTSSLFLSADRRIQGFGALIAVSFIVVEFWFSHAFISVWCFLAATLSLCVLVIFMLEARMQRSKVLPLPQ